MQASVYMAVTTIPPRFRSDSSVPTDPYRLLKSMGPSRSNPLPTQGGIAPLNTQSPPSRRPLSTMVANPSMKMQPPFMNPECDHLPNINIQSPSRHPASKPPDRLLESKPILLPPKPNMDVVALDDQGKGESRSRLLGLTTKFLPTRAPLGAPICLNFLRKYCPFRSRCLRVHVLFLREGTGEPEEVCVNGLSGRCRGAGENAGNQGCTRRHLKLEEIISSRAGSNEAGERLEPMHTVDIQQPAPPCPEEDLPSTSKPVVRFPAPAQSNSSHESQSTPAAVFDHNNSFHDQDTDLWGQKGQEPAGSDSEAESHSNDTKAVTSSRETSMSSSVCRNWSRTGGCVFGPQCNFAHVTPTQSLPIRRPLPAAKEVCRKWLRNVCNRGSNCPYIHEDVKYDDPEPPPALPPEPPITVILHDHTKVKIGPGFEVSDVASSEETAWLILGNVPNRILLEDREIQRLVQGFGEVLDVVPLSSKDKKEGSAKVRFASHSAAQQATRALDGKVLSGKTRLSAQIAVNSRTGMATMQDRTIRLVWEIPHKTAYCGYSDYMRVERALASARAKPFGDNYVYAANHIGLPSLGAFTLKITNIPPDATEKMMDRFGNPDEVVWARANYSALQPAVEGIKHLLQTTSAGFLELDVQTAPFSHGAVKAWAVYESRTAARIAAGLLHNRKPRCIGRSRLSVKHVQTLIYSLATVQYDRDARLIDALRDEAHRAGMGSSAVVTRRNVSTALVRLSAQCTQDLGMLKAEFERILRGDILRVDGVSVWNAYFSRPDGMQFTRMISARTGSRIVSDPIRRCIKLFGTMYQRALARKHLLQKLHEVQAQRVDLIRAENRVISAFITSQLSGLARRFGPENVVVDIRDGKILFRGGEEIYRAGVEAVHAAQQSVLGHEVANTTSCPVCFNTVVSPITLSRCGHAYCSICFSQYILASIENRRFPLTCLGGDAKCTELIPLSAVRSVLDQKDFNSVVEVALSSFVHSHAKELHYCPSPDCQQIYRTGPKGTVVHCPSCLLRICSFCHTEAHDGIVCQDSWQDTDKLFASWINGHDVKKCAGCGIPIEREEGCHHVTCTQCHTHMCWVCSKTFPEGDGIYAHMRAEHGGIGL
ncbi:unnamed protein product [Mycena citricolor]|uniref:Uncharacterized protein n=1 Tax=Mycena citricolor TaxID=2018698 RepID=A0AAD2HCA6_9AGAR|nr:unnamed protein product [Mycena citricolor]